MIICLQLYHQLQRIAFTYNNNVLYNHNGQETSDLVHLPFTFQVQFKTPMGAGTPLHKRSKLTDIRAICEGAIPLTLNHMEIWQTQNRLCGRAGEIPAISSISLRLNRPRIQASVLKGVA
jgi:hypothetical protein